MVYNWLLRKRIDKMDKPGHLVLILNESDLLKEGGVQKLSDFMSWCRDLSIPRVSIHVHLIEPSVEIIDEIKSSVSDTVESAEIITPEEDPRKTDQSYVVSVGLTGKSEFIDAIKSMARKVETGEVDPDDITTDELEEELLFMDEPDIIIKTGGEHLSDFMIWQSVYSEIYFTDLNWHNIRKRDLLRSIREYQKRERRYGR